MEAQQTTPSNGTAQAVVTAAQAKALLDNIGQDRPDRWPAAVKTLIVDAFSAIERLNAAVGTFYTAVVSIGRDLETGKVEQSKLVESHKQLILLVKALQEALHAPQVGAPMPNAPMSGAPMSGAAPGEADMTAAVEQAEAASEVTGAASDPPPPTDLTPNQREAEAAMDAAIAAAAVDKQPDAPPAPRRARR